jgi:ribosome biogenesis protein ENP2
LYEEAKLISNPDMWQEQRAKSIAEKINKERESRIRGNKKVSVKVNQALAEKMRAKEEERERRRAKRVLKQGGDDDMVDAAPAVEAPEKPAGLLGDARFARLFEDEDFEVDEQSHEFQAINPSTKIPKGLTAAEQEELEDRRGSSDSDASDSEEEERPVRKAPADTRISSSSYRKAGHHNPMEQKQRGPQMVVSNSNAKKNAPKADKTFGSRVSKLKDRAPKTSTTTVVGEREITFAPEPKKKKSQGGEAGQRHDRRKEKNIRSASNNAFRGM